MLQDELAEHGFQVIAVAIDENVDNVRAFMDAVLKAKPAGAKGAYVKKIALSSTMGPGVTISVDNAVPSA